MRGQKVVPKGSRKVKVGGAGSAVGSAGVSAVGSPAGASQSKPTKSDANIPLCTGCGTLVSAEVRALQCDRCERWDQWKCIECLGLTFEVYDAMIESKEICWFCKSCNKEVSGMKEQKEDKVLVLLEKMMDKLNDMEDKLHQKADVMILDDLKCRIKRLEDGAEERLSSGSRVQQLEDDMMRQVSDIKAKLSQNSEKLTKLETNRAVVEGEEAMSLDEQHETEKRKKNMILYKVGEIQSDDASDRKAGDMLFLHELCNDVLGVTVGNGDVEAMYRLGKREEDKVRPLLVKFGTEDLKRRVMGRAKELKFADDKFKRISLAHDLTPRQRAQVKEVRTKAMEDLRADQQNDSDEGQQGNYRIIVVGQTTGKPRAIKVSI